MDTRELDPFLPGQRRTLVSHGDTHVVVSTIPDPAETLAFLSTPDGDQPLPSLPFPFAGQEGVENHEGVLREVKRKLTRHTN